MSARDTAWHTMPLAALSAALATEVGYGLTPQETERRLQQWGQNVLQRSETISPLAQLLGQFQSRVIWVLLAAAVISIGLGELVDGLAILAIVVLNAGIGFLQEYRAEQAVAALAAFTAPGARVLRGGRTGGK